MSYGLCPNLVFPGVCVCVFWGMLICGFHYTILHKWVLFKLSFILHYIDIYIYKKKVALEGKGYPSII